MKIRLWLNAVELHADGLISSPERRDAIDLVGRLWGLAIKRWPDAEIRVEQVSRELWERTPAAWRVGAMALDRPPTDEERLAIGRLPCNV